jgi:rRNA maturation endonuclease Nob1
MAWHPFCWGCFKFYRGDAPSDVNGGRCPSCGRELDFKDENNPPDRSEQSSHL